jgi:hypothetical protein
MLVADGQKEEMLLNGVLHAERTHIYGPRSFGQLATKLADISAYLEAHAEEINSQLLQGNGTARIHMLGVLEKSNVNPSLFAKAIVKCAVDSAKTVREAAEPLVKSLAADAIPLVRECAANGNAEGRQHAIRLFSQLAGDGAKDFLIQQKEIEKNAKVQMAIEAALRNSEFRAAAPVDPVIVAPKSVLELDGPVTPAIEGEFRKCYQRFNEGIEKGNTQLIAHQARFPQSPKPTPIPLFSERQIHQLWNRFSKGEVEIVQRADQSVRYAAYGHGDGFAAIQSFVELPDLKLLHFIRWMILIGEVGPQWYGDKRIGFLFNSASHIDRYRSAHDPKITLLDLEAALIACGLPAETIARDLLDGYFRLNWESESVWPYFAKHADLLVNSLNPPQDRAHYWQWSRVTVDVAFDLLSKFPDVSPALIGGLWEKAVGTNKTDRIRAQKVIQKLPDLQERLAETLAKGNAESRAIAAEWLGRLGDRGANGPLEHAARKEKHDVPLDEMLNALVKLGKPIDAYLDRSKLQADAEKGLKKGIPEALAWFPWSQVPGVHWSDSGEAVSPDITKWMLVQSYRQKSAEFRPEEREALGQFVFGAWLNADLKRKHTDAEARAMARQQAAQTWQNYQQYAQQLQQRGQPAFKIPWQSQQHLEDQIFHGLTRECGTAIGEKGLLALAAACCGDAAVGIVQNYLKEWYGYRASQCKALIAMLSCIERPSAIQFLLSIANRFRTKGIREEAEKYVNILAERKGWTLDELADRTMPTAGFGDDGRLELDFGPRKFVAQVNAELEIVLRDETGKALKKLPDPRKDDDEQLAKTVKKAFSAAKTELKKFAGLQGTRLYEAMCTERSWPAADWRAYLLKHPLLRFLCQRIVWGEVADGEIRQTFRPLDDGTLTDQDDRAITLEDGATICIVHGSRVPVAVGAAWAKHLADYEVSPPFTQFGRDGYLLPEQKRKAHSIDDFRGYMIEAFRLRGLATRFGYTHGRAEDGGWFLEYLKSFPGLGLQVHLQFSGNSLPEENRTVALDSISFDKPMPQAAHYFAQSSRISLGQIPSVLLSECYDDLRTIAAAGTGFDPDWEKKVH